MSPPIPSLWVCVCFFVCVRDNLDNIHTSRKSLLVFEFISVIAFEFPIFYILFYLILRHWFSLPVNHKYHLYNESVSLLSGIYEINQLFNDILI